jgi:MFS family permease
VVEKQVEPEGIFTASRPTCHDARVYGRLAGLISPLRQREVRTLSASQLISGLGDWAGRLALSVLVFERSQSAWWAAAVTIAALLPWLGPGQVLATFADRFGRVRVMVGADIARACVFGLMLIPQPVWLLLVWAFVAGLAVPPFVGARASAMVEVIAPEHYGSALALRGVLSQVEVLAGYAGGGLLVAAVGAHTALAINAFTFLISAFLLRSLSSTAASTPNHSTPVGWEGVVAGTRVWRMDPICMRALYLFVGVSMFMILPEVLVVPFTAELDVPNELIGVFASLIAIGSIIGMVMVPTKTDHVALLRSAALRAGALAGLSGVLFSIGAVPAVAGLAFVVSGAVDAIAVPTNQVVGERLPVEGRSAAMAVAGGVQYGAQVVSISIAGVVATISSARIPLSVGMFCAMAICSWAVLRPPVTRTVDERAEVSRRPGPG